MIKGGLLVLVIAAVTAIVIPKYASAEKAGKELTIKSFLRTVAVVNKSYRLSHRKYAKNLEELARETRIETIVAAATEIGYDYSYVGGRNTWSCAADPSLPELTHFFVDQSGVIRFRADGSASSRDAEVE